MNILKQQPADMAGVVLPTTGTGWSYADMFAGCSIALGVSIGVNPIDHATELTRSRMKVPGKQET